MTGDFQLDYAGMGEYLRSEEIKAAMLTRAEKVKAAAEAMAPFDASDPAPHYKDCFEVEVGVQTHKTARAYAEVKNTSAHAFYVEFGTRNNPRHRTLGKAVGLE